MDLKLYRYLALLVPIFLVVHFTIATKIANRHPRRPSGGRIAGNGERCEMSH
jgi:hypothetical protein